MKKITNGRKKEFLKQVIWDYNVPPHTLLNILEKKQEKYFHIDRKYLINRCFNYLNWYQFVSLFDRDKLLEAIEELKFTSSWQKRYNKSYTQGLEFAKRFLRKEALSSPG